MAALCGRGSRPLSGVTSLLDCVFQSGSRAALARVYGSADCLPAALAPVTGATSSSTARLPAAPLCFRTCGVARRPDTADASERSKDRSDDASLVQFRWNSHTVGCARDCRGGPHTSILDEYPTSTPSPRQGSKGQPRYPYSTASIVSTSDAVENGAGVRLLRP